MPVLRDIYFLAFPNKSVGYMASTKSSFPAPSPQTSAAPLEVNYRLISAGLHSPPHSVLAFAPIKQTYQRKMNIELYNKLDYLDNQVEATFYDFLLKKAQFYGFDEAKQRHWIQYAMDASRGEKTVKHILNYFKLPSGKEYKVLDIGCGFGNLLIALQQDFEQVSGIDIASDRVEWAKKRASHSEVICANAIKLPWPDNEFDLVISTDVFEHLSYPEQQLAVSELLRVLKPGGCGYIEVPNRFQLLDEHNLVLFATWLPNSVRKNYVKLVSKSRDYIPCWERTGRGWKQLFKLPSLHVTIRPHYLKDFTFLRYFLIPPNRYKIYLRKQ